MATAKTGRAAAPPARSPLRHALSQMLHLVHLAYLFTESNLFTFVLPNVAFGLLAALSPSLLSHPPFPLAHVLSRLPPTLLFNWSNLLIFDLANQRLPESIREDTLNKPWRPLPTKRATPEATRSAMLLLIPAVLAINHVALRVGHESSLILLLTWLYNDLRGGDTLARDLIIATAFGVYNAGSLRVATGLDVPLSPRGYIWVFTISGIIFTTMQVQDLKDQRGDASRGRRTVPLVFGEAVSRRSIAILTPFWALFCVWFWGLGVGMALLPVGVAAVVAWRVVLLRSPRADAVTWKVWCLWTCVLYALPFMA